MSKDDSVPVIGLSELLSSDLEADPNASDSELSRRWEAELLNFYEFVWRTFYNANSGQSSVFSPDIANREKGEALFGTWSSFEKFPTPD